jgi:hypothetical protein
MRTTARHRTLVAGAATASVLALAACGSSSSGGAAATPSAAPSSAVAASPSDTASAGASASASAAGGSGAVAAGSLKGVCPDTVVIQTDWNPESEHGALYQVVGANPTIDASKKTVTGPLMAGTVDTGVKVQVRAGGPAIGFQTVSAQMYLDKAITLGYVSTDEAVQLSASQPTTAVVATNEKSPFIIMWDPATYPDVKTIADLGSKNVKVMYFNGASYMEYLLGKGILKKSQVDGSYDGTPATFVSSRGKVAQQGFATAEPFIYENEVAAWKKPVAYQLVADTGFDIYPEALAIRTAEKAALSPCLKALVPIMQQAQVDYVKTPATANTLILDLVKKYNNGWVYSQGVADFSVKKQVELGVVGNGPDSTLGNFDEARVQGVIDILNPIFAKQGKPAKAGLKPTDVVDNEFIDPKIGLS